MKTFRELLAESTKTYAVRVKIAGDLPEAFEKKFKDYMTKYEVVEFKKVGSTPVQEHPHEFPRIKNKEVAIFDVETSYPMSFPQLEGVLAEQFGLSLDHVKVKHPADVTEIMPDDEGEYESKLMDNEYKDSPKTEPTFGDEYNMSLFKELMKDRSEQSATQEAGKLISMGDEQGETLLKREDKNPEGVQAGSITRHSK
tara:strand:+ start:2380 stop:2973 length:594 start_codon:yes stop_codon:yes gene_type:complete